MPKRKGRPPSVHADRPGHGATILVVEERRRDRRQLVSILASQGYVVFEASDARTALELIDRQRPQLVISSANARPVGGPDFVRRLRANPDLVHTPVAFYAGARDEPRARAAASRVGIREVLTDCTSPDAVLQSVRALLAEGLAWSAAHAIREPRSPVAESVVVAGQAGATDRPQIVVRAETPGELVRLGETAGVLTAAASSLRLLVGADVAALGFFDLGAREASAAIILEGTAARAPLTAPATGEDATWRLETNVLQAVREGKTIRWPQELPGSGLPAAAAQGNAVRPVIATPLKSAERVWGWLSVGRRMVPVPFSERDERLVALVATHACNIGDGLRSVDGLQGPEALLPTRELHRASVREVEHLAAWELDAALETFTWSDSFAALAGRDEMTSLRRSAAVLALVHPDDRQSVSDVFKRTAASGAELDIECRGLLPDASERTIQIVGRADRGSGGRLRRLYGIVSDVTERRRLEGRLFQAQRTSAMGLLAASVAHDFNNVLTAILGQARLLADDLTDAHHRREMEQIHRTAERGTKLTRQLLAFSRTQGATHTLVGLNDVIDELAPMLRRLIGEHIVLRTDLSPDAPAVRLDRAQLEQVILNLVVNARDAMPGGGSIDIRTARTTLRGDEQCRDEVAAAGVYALLSVTDTGTGIDERVRTQIFDPFFTTKSHGEGTGLGLTTVSTVVKRCGGYLDLRSSPGKGSAFHVYLPAVERRTTVVTPPQVTPEAVRQGSRVLVIEDEPEVRSLVRSVLERVGYQVVEASGAQEAEATIARLAGNIDLVIADVLIPGGTGPELVRRLVEVRPSIRAIFMSGYPDDALAASAALEPSAAFVQKPFTIEGLLQVVREVLLRPPRA